MTIILDEDFEGGAGGATVGTGNSGFTAVLGTAVTFDTSWSVTGTRSALVSSTSAVSTLTYNWGTLRDVGAFRLYFRFPALPSAAQYLMGLSSTSGGGAIRAQLRINADGSLRLRNGITVTGTDTAALATDTDYRAEWVVDGPGGTQTLTVYPLHSTTALTGTSGTFTDATFETLGFGLVQAGTWTYRADRVAVADVATEVGPVAVLRPPQPRTVTRVAVSRAGNY